MRIKTFYAKSMADAMQEIKEVLGPDALLLSTREIRRRSGVGWPVSGYEVVAACDDRASAGDDLPPSAKAPEARSIISSDERESGPPGHERAVARPRASFPSRLDRQAAGMPLDHNPRLTVASRRPAADTSGRMSAEPLFPDALSGGLYQDLLASGVEEELTRRLLLKARDLVAPADRHLRSALLDAAGQATQAFLSGVSFFEEFPGKRIVAFIGPTGVGKTTSIAKLAARLALKERKKVVLLTMDGYRIGALEQARTYANLIGIPFRFVNQVGDLRQVVREYGQRDCILIDTAGRSPRDQEAIRFTADCLQSLEQVERHLVLSAGTKPSDIRDIVERFRLCRPDHLLFTKLDETTTLGPILNEIIRTRTPLSYYSDGQRVPEDFHTVPPEQLIHMVLQKN